MKKPAWYENITPFLFAIFPILSLARENIDYIHVSAILRSTIYSSLLVLIFYLIFYAILKDRRKSGILSGLLVFILLTYGNIYLSIQNWFGEPPEHKVLLAIIAGVYLLGGAYLIFKVEDAKNLNLAMISGIFVMILYLGISIAIYQYKVYSSEERSGSSSEFLSSSLTDQELASLPDIYLILLDGHTRSDVLREDYDFDNSEFTNQLEEMGFWVAKCSHSNYPSTRLSLATLFEMDYLHHIYQDYDNLVLPPLNNTAVFKTLENHHYSIVTFHNYVFEHFNIKDDYRYAKEDNLFGSISEFEKQIVETSILRILIDLEGAFPEAWIRPFEDSFYLTHYRDTLYALETLPKLPERQERLFVFAHLLVTHDPFVFTADGSFSASKFFTADDYTNSVAFIDSALPEIVNKIIQNSETPPVIIIMGDHGSTVKGTSIEDRMKTLFAVYLQGENPEKFYDDISPVNVFRIIFNDMFDADYELIDEKSYEIWNTYDLGNLSKRVFPSCDP